MALVVHNNIGAMLTLGKLNKNTAELGKQLKKVSSGQKITGADDGAAEYSISEKMRVCVRALYMDDENVQRGASMLRVAEGGVQEQIEILKGIKAKVIDANNDTNTDEDRKIIQKEIDHGYEQINDIAAMTIYNNRRLLLGSKVRDVELHWSKLDEAIVQPDSDANIISDESWEYTEEGKAGHQYHPTLDGVEGPFDIFHEYEEKASKIDSLGLAETNAFSGGEVGTASTYKMTLGGYDTTWIDTDNDGVKETNQDNVSRLNNVGFCIDNEFYVLTDDTSQKFKISGVTPHVIDISGCSSYEDVAAQIVSEINSSNGTVTASIDPDNAENVIYTTKAKGVASAHVNIAGVGQAGFKETVTVGYKPAVPAQPAKPATTIPGTPAVDIAGTSQPPEKIVFSSQDNLSGGTNSSGNNVSAPPGDHDWKNPYPYVPGSKASLSRTVSGVPEESGITIHGTGTAYLKFISGTTGLTKGPDGVYTVGTGASVSGTLGGLDLSISNGVLKLTAPSEGSSGNGYYVSDSIYIPPQPDIVIPATPATPAIPEDPGTKVTTEYSGVSVFDSVPEKDRENGISITQGGSPGKHASLTIPYPADGTDVEDFIKDLRSKSITYFDGQYEFIDSAGGIYAEPMASTGQSIDLNPLRAAVASGTSLKDAFKSLMLSADSRTYTKYGEWDADTHTYPTSTEKCVTADDSGITITVPYAGASGNYDTLSVRKGSLRHYDIDFKTWYENNGGTSLDGKGFRFYCATDSHEWWNIMFVDGEIDEERPVSGTEGDVIKSIVINVAGVNDAESLAQAVYQQAEPYMEGRVEGFENYNHYMRFLPAGDGVLTLYDWRHYNVNNMYYDYQEEGAKIADGIIDNVQLKRRKILCDDLIIHHTDKASMNIHILIPRTTMDQVFGFIPEDESVYDYKVTDAEMRTRLLGKHPSPRGILDKGLDYLTDANIIIGSQTMRMGIAANNIVAQRTNVQASESTIRDADMAKEMVGFVKANILSQTSQSMLAQANQNSSSVLSLLQ